ncbi:hypothetical protein KP509_16G007400 [Ceratopteris richardii]|uniref:Subtilisin-like protease SBT1.7 n=1 Tax=Ceratopteris richardii TaxID=49495 RepID=A0A8T2SYH5_CERRI|nr:hypothetical protein KP509_16G007400 [Ceratopteris richardii]
MAIQRHLLSILFALIVLCEVAVADPQHEDLLTYIVHASTNQKPPVFSSTAHWYAASIASVTGLPLHLSLARHGPLYTYQTVFHGFSAKLTPAQSSSLLLRPGFVLAVQDKVLQLHTTHTPVFLHLTPSDGVLPSSGYGHDVIVGVIDTGIWPERPSFNDGRFDEVPSRWKGECEEGTDFNSSFCNKKFIGARYFYKGYEAAKGPMDESAESKSPRDTEGHGTHTSSTAVGDFVANVSLFGYASGDARGMAMDARLAVYKVCWEPGCYDSDILAAFDSAVADGVDIISLSVGGDIVPLYKDSIALGSYGAMEQGVLVSCSAGNSGPSAGSVRNVAPWVLTVAASSIDRTFPAPIVLGDGSSYEGISLYGGMSFWEEGEQLPLVYAGDAALNGSESAYLCETDTLDPGLVQGKLVLCERGSNARVAKGYVVKAAGGMGMILANTFESGAELIADSHLIPAALVSFEDGVAIKKYISSYTSNATASMEFKGTKLGVTPAPTMAAFSSRGPNLLPPEILKPDITAPGLNILAAYTGKVGPTGLDGDDRLVDFSIMSGTSMSCPHVSGLAALLKAVYPGWSPAAIKSALMTTSSILDNTGESIKDLFDGEAADPFAYGAGHVNPTAALDPGLVYDLSVQDYVNFLCSLGYKDAYLQIFTKGKYECTNELFRARDLNYPSFALVFNKDEENVTVTRSVTNVGDANATYTVQVVAPAGMNITVEPEVLEFNEENSILNYKVKFQISLDAQLQSLAGIIRTASTEHAFGSLTWTDGVHKVRSPIAITYIQQNSYAATRSF